jgi:Zn finger protein HypA/HybF involved in hydrogenase expression
MKECPNCHSEVEDGFDMCWNCSYSFDEKEVVAFEDAETTDITKNIDCLRCKVPMLYSGNFKFHEGTRYGVFGNLFEAFTNRESFDLYVCPKCRKVEFFLPE